MKTQLILILVSLSYSVIFGQVDTTKSVYKNLEVKKFYSGGSSMVTLKGKTIYKVDDKVVDESSYTLYNESWKNMETCKPCVLETYDGNGVLQHKAEQYTDCAVGQWIEYYSDGKIKVIGHFKENDTGNWDKAYERGYCSSKNGVWNYYDKDGTIKKTETYLNNKLLE
ncbi:MAG: hypothetical protein NT150_02825 [Bacteroidetes bacterium]|nr:hypothetical protein [Bacteroidota bacterium]